MISIIVPVYNVEKYLGSTLDSILNSTYQDFELILVDDGSTDGSGKICDQYAADDSRIHVIHQKNAGVSGARNAGMEAAKGGHVSFLDADDMIHPEMLSILMSAISSGDYDFSMVHMRKVESDECERMIAHRGLEKDAMLHMREISRDDYMRRLYSFGLVSFQYQSCCNKLFKSSFIRDLHFIKTGTEDTEWNNRMALKMNQGILMDLELYYYINRDSSASHGGVTPRFVDVMNSFKICLDHIPSNQVAYRSWCLEKLYKTMLSTTYRAHGSELSQLALSSSKRLYKETIKEYLQSDIAWSKKYGLLLFYRLPWLYRLFMNCSELVARIKG